MKKFFSSLTYDWPKYVISILASILIWAFAFNVYHMPKENEELTFFYSGVVNDYSFKNDMLDLFEDDSIISVELQSSDPADTTFSEKYTIVGLNYSDIVIVKTSIANETYLDDSFKEITLSGYNLLYQEGNAYGIILDNSMKTKLSSYFTFDNDEYCILISAKIYDESLAYKFIEWLGNV